MIRYVVAGMLALGIVASAIPVLGVTFTTNKQYDHDGDGGVTINDAIIVVSHIGEEVGTPEPCQQWVAYVTPVAYFNTQGTPIGAMNGYYSAPAASSWGMTAIAGNGAQNSIAC